MEEQLRADLNAQAKVQVVSYLNRRAKQLNSRVLSALAVRVAEDPFEKVKKMIKDLIVRLMEEANEEAEHKGWCDTELGTNEQTRKEKTSAVETLHAEFDEKAGEATALLQQAPEIFDAPYQGLQSESGGVVGMLEVIQSDFARLETETKAAEAEAQRMFDKFTSESAVNCAQNAKDVEHKTTKKTNSESALTSKKADLEGTQKELDAALAYYDKLKPSCVDAGVSYDDRVARRKEEI